MTRRAAAGCACAALWAFAAAGAPPSATPGPAERVGGAIDHGWSRVSGGVAEALLVARVRVALLERLGEDGLRVTIAAHEGAVELSGHVERSENAALAGRVAASVDGVRAVSNRVNVAADAQASEPPVARTLGKVEHGVADALLEARVKVRLLGELGTAGFKIGVDASRGAVTLSGTVPDAERRKVATRIVGGTSGVKEVRDRLVVQQ